MCYSNYNRGVFDMNEEKDTVSGTNLNNNNNDNKEQGKGRDNALISFFALMTPVFFYIISTLKCSHDGCSMFGLSLPLWFLCLLASMSFGTRALKDNSIHGTYKILAIISVSLATLPFILFIIVGLFYLFKVIYS